MGLHRQQQQLCTQQQLNISNTNSSAQHTLNACALRSFPPDAAAFRSVAHRPVSCSHAVALPPVGSAMRAEPPCSGSTQVAAPMWSAASPCGIKCSRWCTSACRCSRKPQPCGTSATLLPRPAGHTKCTLMVSTSCGRSRGLWNWQGQRSISSSTPEVVGRGAPPSQHCRSTGAATQERAE